MGVVSPGFSSRGRSTPDLPPGQYLSEDFPVLSAGRRPRRGRRLAVHHHHRDRRVHERDWSAFRALATEPPTDDLPCVTRWSKLATSWEGVSLDTLLAEVGTGATTRRWTPTADTYRTCAGGRARRQGVGCLPVRRGGRLECLASRIGAIGQEHVREASRAKGGP
jgi:hypothetical protein